MLPKAKQILALTHLKLIHGYNSLKLYNLVRLGTSKKDQLNVWIMSRKVYYQ